MVTDIHYIPDNASWNWAEFFEGQHILVHAGPGGPDVFTSIANTAIVAGQGVEFAAHGWLGVGSSGSKVGAGVAINSAPSGGKVSYCIKGRVRGVTAAGSITAGNRLGHAATGTFGALADSADTKCNVGISMVDASDTNTFIAYIRE